MTGGIRSTCRTCDEIFRGAATERTGREIDGLLEIVLKERGYWMSEIE